MTLPISTTSITITNLTNLLSVPFSPPPSALLLYTTDTTTDKVAQSIFDSTTLAPNTPATALSYSYVRSSTSIGGFGTLSITYLPKLASVTSAISIELPLNQMKMLSNGCNIKKGSTIEPCPIISSN